MLSIFVSGLEKQTGKTIVCAGLSATMQSLSYSTSVYKPIQTNAFDLSGFKCSPDINLIKKFDSNITTNSTYIFENSYSPFFCAEKEGTKININNIFAEYQSLAQVTDCVVVEGSNGLAAPIAQYMTELDMIKALKIPLLFVVNPKINSTELLISGLKYLQSEQIQTRGIVINQFEENKSESVDFIKIIKDFSDINILGFLPNYESISGLAPETLISDVLNNMDIEEIFGLKIAKLR